MAGAIFFNDNKNDIFWGGVGCGEQIGCSKYMILFLILTVQSKSMVEIK